MSTWRLIEGEGERQLERISHSVDRLRALSTGLKIVSAIGKSLASQVPEHAKSMVNQAAADSDPGSAIDRLIDGLDPATQKDILRLYFANLAESENAALAYDMMDHRSNQKARVTVMKTGVSVLKSFANLGIGGERNVEVGSIIDGRIQYVSLAPIDGGHLSLYSGLHGKEVFGLLDPKTCEPRVELEIFGRC